MRSKLRGLLAVLAAVGVLLAMAAPAMAQEGTTGGGETTSPRGTTAPDEGGGHETGACEIDNADFRVMFIRPTEDDLSFMDCPPDAYYLTYVDTRGFVGKISDMISQPAQNTYEAAQKTALNSMASTIFVWHAKVIATTTNVMGWAFGFDPVQMFSDQVEAVTQALEDSIFDPLLVVVWGCAIGYGAYLSIARDQVGNGVGVIVKSAVIGCIGIMTLKEPTRVVDWYQGVINQATGWVFGLVGEITGDTKPGDVKPDGTVENPEDEEKTRPDEGAPRNPEDGEKQEMSALAQMIWRNYVQVPWTALQLNSGDPYTTVDGDLDNQLLDIKYPQDRRKWLCEQAECSVFAGAPEDTGGGETTGGTTGGGETTGGGLIPGSTDAPGLLELRPERGD